MTVRQLPDRPNLDQLKRQAKDLLQAARAQDGDALARFRILPAHVRTPALHDAQSVIAREHGFASWNDLRERVEELTLALDQAVVQFVEAATGDRPDRAERLLALHPAIPKQSFHAALVLGDVAEVERRLAARPELALAKGGPRGWEPLHYLCHDALVRRSAEAGVIAIAKRLLALGGDPNLRYPWQHHGVYRPILWGAVCIARSLPLAQALLDAGADPSDGVTLPLAASGGDLAALELLHAHGVDPNRAWASDDSAPLYAILHWSRTDTGVRWLLAHGADPDPVFADNGETPLHVAAATWSAALVEELVTRGADVERRRKDGRTPYAVAALHGNREVEAWLRDHGASTEVSQIDRLVAACSAGDRVRVDALLRDDPGLRTQIAAEHYGAFYAAIERNDLPVIAAMLACGFDPNRPDESIGKTALHVAAHEGWPEAAKLLLAHGAAVAAQDREFHGTPLVWAADGARTNREGRDHEAVGKLLLAAGSPVDWPGSDEPSDTLGEILAAWRGLPHD